MAMFSDLVKNVMSDYYTILICRIETVNKNGLIDVVPVSKINDISLPKITMVPMLQMGNRQINMSMEFFSGDIIPCLVSTLDISPWISREEGDVQQNKRGGMTNAIALPMVMSTEPNNFEIPRDILINGDGVWNGNVTINGNVKINGNIDISGNSTASDHVSGGISGNSHIHSGDSGGKTSGPK